MITLPAGTRIWLAAGVTDMRCGFQGLATKVQATLEENPLCGHVFIFRGRRGDLVKLLWATDDGLWLLSKRLERGRFICRKPMAARSRSRSRSCRCFSKASIGGSPAVRHLCRCCRCCKPLGRLVNSGACRISTICPTMSLH